MPTDARERLRARQDGLVRALVAGAPLPQGFDAAWAAATSGSLLRKRTRGVARAWPRLARALGSAFAPLFAEYASTSHPASEGYYSTDGARFAAWLRASRRLPDEGRVELALWRVSTRRAALDAALLSDPPGLVLAWRLGPLAGARTLRFRGMLPARRAA